MDSVSSRNTGAAARTVSGSSWASMAALSCPVMSWVGKISQPVRENASTNPAKNRKGITTEPPFCFPILGRGGSAVLLANVLHVMQPSVEDTEWLDMVAAAAEGAEALFVVVAETGGADSQEAEDQEDVQR